jgi:predicted small lipoprotein YifL
MTVKQAIFVLQMLSWLAACTTTGPLPTTDTTEPKETAVQDQKDQTANLAEHPETSPATSADDASTTTDAGKVSDRIAEEEVTVLTLARLLESLDRIATLDPGSTKQLIRQMEARFEELNPADRYELALLLTLNNANSKTLNRAISILDDLKTGVKDRIAQEILDLHRRSFVLEKQYLSEHSKTIELTKKIERLKGLEQDLDKSNTRIQESLNPPPGERQQP